VHLLLTLAVATAAPQTLPAETEAQPATLRQRLRQRRQATRHVDFDDPVAVLGEVVDPGIDIFIDRPVPAHPPLFDLRADFNDEMEQSTHLVK